MDDRSHLLTEQRLEASRDLDAMSVAEAVALMNREDARAVEAVGRVGDAVAAAVELVAGALGRGGRLIYVGAGTSGRLGVLDASECPPTFRTDPRMVQAVIAGGEAAVFRSQERAEDRAGDGAAAMDEREVDGRDVVLGIAAGGTTPFVHGALARARERGAGTVFLTCVQPTPNEPAVDLVIRPLVGPEVVTGSTRLKAGTATKLVLNAISTLAMVRLGKVHENLMVDLRASNQKLWDRGARIVAMLTGLEREAAMPLLHRADGHVKAAVLMHHRNVDLSSAQAILKQQGGSLRAALAVDPQSSANVKPATIV
jgi:N-acetylmuramic acid 6-phosphate etherase